MIPSSLNAKEARKEAEERTGEEKSPAEEIGEQVASAMTTAVGAGVGGLPGFAFEAEAPARLSERARARAAASWRVTGNWLVLFLGFMGLATLGLEWLKDDADVEISSLIWAVVLAWVVCQLMRLVMIMGYGKVKLRLGSDAGNETELKPAEPGKDPQ